MPVKKRSCKTVPGARVSKKAIKRDLNSIGYRLPHGYDVVKISCKKKKPAKPAKRSK